MKRLILGALFLLAMSSGFAAEVARLVIPFTPGGPFDRLGRVLADALQTEMGGTVVVENKAGANGAIAASYVEKATNGEKTMFLVSPGVITISPALYKNLPFDPVNGLKPVMMVATSTAVAVTGNLELRDAADVAARLKAKPQSLSGGSSGIGSSSHFSIEMFNEAVGSPMLHVPYKGASEVVKDMLGRRVDLFIGDLPGLLPLINAGKLKVLGIVGPNRAPEVPGVPTLDEQGLHGIKPIGWYGLLVPANAPADRVQALNETITRVLNKPEVRQRFADIGASPAPSSVKEFTEFLERDRQSWAEFVKRRNITVTAN